MVLGLAQALELTLRERNVLLGSAGFAPAFSANPLDSFALEPIKRAVDLLLSQQEPYGAVLVDRGWNVLQANHGAMRLLGEFLDVGQLDPRIANNLVRAALHPAGLRPWIINWPTVATVTVERLERELAHFPLDETRAALLAEIKSYPDVAALPACPTSVDAPFAQIHLQRGATELRVFSMLSTLGTPLDVTAQELTIELFFPADDATARWFKQPSAATSADAAG